MFTGIVTDIGRIVAVERRGDTVFTVGTRQDLSDVRTGASIACSGICLTVVSTASTEEGGRFVVSVSAETLSRSTAGAWVEGTEINLERALRLGDELGGHVVSGHVDGLAELLEIRPEGDSHRALFEVPAGLAPFVAAKGSVTLDGISLTVNEVDGPVFGVNIIPHTWEFTTLRARRPGDRLNFEADMLARYVARLLAVRGS